jgi:hypothetical protein
MPFCNKCQQETEATGYKGAYCSICGEAYSRTASTTKSGASSGQTVAVKQPVSSSIQQGGNIATKQPTNSLDDPGTKKVIVAEIVNHPFAATSIGATTEKSKDAKSQESAPTGQASGPVPNQNQPARRALPTPPSNSKQSPSIVQPGEKVITTPPTTKSTEQAVKTVTTTASVANEKQEKKSKKIETSSLFSDSGSDDDDWLTSPDSSGSTSKISPGSTSKPTTSGDKISLFEEDELLELSQGSRSNRDTSDPLKSVLEKLDEEERHKKPSASNNKVAEAERSLIVLFEKMKETHPELVESVTSEVLSASKSKDANQLQEIHTRLTKQAEEVTVATRKKVNEYLQSLKGTHLDKTAEAEQKIKEAGDNPAQLEQIHAELELTCTDERDLEKLGVEKHIELLKQAKKWAKDPLKKPLLQKLYKSIPLDAKFQEDDKKRRTQVLKAIRNDVDIQKARAQWQNLPAKDKVDALQNAIALQWTALEMKGRPPNIVVNVVKVKKSEPGSTNATREYVNQGSYNSTTHEITLNRYVDEDEPTKDLRGALVSFDGALDTVVHETAHAYQGVLGKQVDELWLANDPRADQARLFRLNDGAYLATEDADHETYKKQPLERHAWLAGGEARRLFSFEANMLEAKQITESIALHDPELSARFAANLKKFDEKEVDPDMLEQLSLLLEHLKAEHARLDEEFKQKQQEQWERWEATRKRVSEALQQLFGIVLGVDSKGPIAERHAQLKKQRDALVDAAFDRKTSIQGLEELTEQMGSLLASLNEIKIDELQQLISGWDNGKKECWDIEIALDEKLLLNPPPESSKAKWEQLQLRAQAALKKPKGTDEPQLREQKKEFDEIIKEYKELTNS